jgi:hypothetical protein
MFKFSPHFILFFHSWIFPFEITYFEQIFMLTHLLNHNLMQRMGFWFLFHLLAHYCFWLLYMFCGFGVGLIIRRFTKCFNTLFLNFYGTHVCSLGVAYTRFGGFMNYVDSKLPRVTKFLLTNHSLSLWKNVFKLDSLRSLKKSMACVNITQLLSSISSLEMFTICLNNARLSLSILTFADHHVPHPSLLSIALFHSIPHVLVSSKCSKGH